MNLAFLMTVFHTVTFKVRDGVSSDQISACGEALKKLVSIDGVISVRTKEDPYGFNVNRS